MAKVKWEVILLINNMINKLSSLAKKNNDMPNFSNRISDSNILFSCEVKKKARLFELIIIEGNTTNF